VHCQLVNSLNGFAYKELNELTLKAWHFVLCGVDEPLLALIVGLKQHQVHQSVCLAHVGVACYNAELTVLEPDVLVKFVDAKLACVKVFTLQRSLKVW